MPLSRWSDLLRTCWAPSCGYFMVFHMLQRDDFVGKTMSFLHMFTTHDWELLNMYTTHHHPIIIPRTILKLSNIMTGNGLIYIYHLQKNADDWGMVHLWHRFPHTFHQLHPGTSDSTWIAAGLDLAGREPATFDVWWGEKLGKKVSHFFLISFYHLSFSLSLEAFEAHVSPLWVLHSSFLCLVPCWTSRKASQPRNKQFLGPISRSETQKVYADCQGQSTWAGPIRGSLTQSPKWQPQECIGSAPFDHQKPQNGNLMTFSRIIGSFHGAYLHIDQLPSPLTTSPAQLRLSKSFPWSDCDIRDVTELRPFKALTNGPLCERSPGHWTSGAQWGPMGPNGAQWGHVRACLLVKTC